ncbi:GTPase family protein [Providencia alcalifaciens]|uniref:GTPase family protein n=1 Tax=Providencia alcalifaciens TaxID=126385 RepID=UPI00029C63C1|nr:GTPase [Providencia alcalifaciens]EKT65506.1 putative small GTP-binding domain protein [Providencia alcalifaciens Dmel2]
MNDFCLMKRKEVNAIVKKNKELIFEDNSEGRSEYIKKSLLNQLENIDREVNEKLYSNQDISIDIKNKLKEIKSNLIIIKRKIEITEKNTVNGVEMDNESQGSKLIKNAVDILPKEIRESVFNRIKNIIDYEPVIGVMGKTGAGKSSLINAIFKGDVCPVSDVEACTRETKEIKIEFGHRSIRLIDIPGVGENANRDNEYEALYKRLLPKMDLILWVVKGDDRAFSADEHFYQQVLKPAGGDKKTVFVLNQIDKIEPFREWDIEHNQPSLNQLTNIRKKEAYLIERFGFTEHPVISVSANEKYNISKLVETMVRALPKEAKSGVVAQVKNDVKTTEIVEEAKGGFEETVDEALDDIIDHYLPKPVASVAKAAKKLVVSAVKKVWNFFFG